MNEPYESLVESERLLAAADDVPGEGRDAAVAALRSLLQEWGVEPRGDSVTALLEQAAETDDTLLQFRPEAARLDRSPDEPDAAERARIFVDAARARLANI
ncbi:MAG: hypothetical protein LC797_01995 [Chloroflexi bacterium]|nr:hypothetical protein [Chloroflexota bacterium]